MTVTYPLDPITERYLRWMRCSCPWDAVRIPARAAQEAMRKKESTERST